MHKNDSSSFVDELRQEFHSNPVNFRVVLPDGSLAVVRRVVETVHGKMYKVQGLDKNGRFRALLDVPVWYPVTDLRLFYWSASIREVAA